MPKNEKKSEILPGSVEYLLDEATRQMEEISRTKDSLDTRGSLVISFAGVILSVFVGVFISYWTSQAAVTMAKTASFSFWFALFLTIAAMFALLLSIVLGLSVLTPKQFEVGPEVGMTYEVAHSPTLTLTGLREAALRSLVKGISRNAETYYRNVFQYNLASLFSVVALFLTVGVVGIILSSTETISEGGRSATLGILCAFSAITILLGTIKGVSMWRSTRQLIEDERRRFANFTDFTAETDRQLGRK